MALILAKMGKDLGLHLHPHKLRYTAIRNMVRRQMPLQAIMQISGHRSLKMIEHYSRLESDDVQELYASAMNGHKVLNELEAKSLITHYEDDGHGNAPTP